MFDWLISPNKTVGKITDAVISTGDKLVFTDEEKADMKMKMREFFPTLLKAYHPFKLAQRILAVWFGFIFGMAFLMAVAMTGFNIYTKFKAMQEGIPLESIVLLDTQMLINIVISFNIHWIMTAIIGFYFTGGVISSFKKDN